MKNVIGLLIGIVISIMVQAQDIVIPDSVATNIIEELIVKDQLAKVVLTQDSVILVLKNENSNLQGKIKIYKTKEEEWKKIVADLNAVIELKDIIIQDLNKKLKNSIPITLKSIGIALAIVGLLLLL